MNRPQLELTKVNTFYAKSHVLQDISLHVEKGRLIGLLGRNGVGKTTTLSSIMGTVTSRSGSILFKGEEIIGLPPYKIANRGIGIVPEDRRVFPTITVRENLLMGIKRSDRKKNSKDAWSIERFYDHFPTLKRRDSHKGGFLSGGEQQMVSIGRTLMGNPSLLLLDEPTEGLGPLIVADLLKMIESINKAETTILLVEQSIKVILQLCQRVYVMGKGKIVFEGTGKELMEDVGVRKKYLEV